MEQGITMLSIGHRPALRKYIRWRCISMAPRAAGVGALKSLRPSDVATAAKGMHASAD